MATIKAVLDSGFHEVDSGFQVPDSIFFVTGTWISGANSFLEFRNP